VVHRPFGIFRRLLSRVAIQLQNCKALYSIRAQIDIPCVGWIYPVCFIWLGDFFGRAFAEGQRPEKVLIHKNPYDRVFWHDTRL
jgi:hypothetical protein